jgi:predicted DNA-binding transcriptional regulator AlpA
MLGSHLRALRLKSETPTVAEVCEKHGIARPTLYLWEGPRSRPEPTEIRRLCVFYGAAESDIAEALRLRSLGPGVEAAGLDNPDTAATG